MDAAFGEGKTEAGPGILITLTGEEVARAISVYLLAQNISVVGPRTITVNGERCKSGSVYVDPSGYAVIDGMRWTGEGDKH